MNIKSRFTGFFLVFGVVCQAAIPEISNVKVLQKSGSGTVNVTYTLENADAVVTAEIQTNRGDGVWIAIDPANFKSLSGDVNVRVAHEPNSSKTFSWDANADWPDQTIRNKSLRAVLTAWAVNAPPEWMAVDLASGAVNYYVSSNSVPRGIGSNVYKRGKMLFRKIDAAGRSFAMVNRSDGETKATHMFSFTRDYYMAVYEITQAQWLKVTGSQATAFTAGPDADMRAMTPITFAGLRGNTNGKNWPNADITTAHGVDEGSFIYKLRELAGNNVLFDLPTEAMWEYACRAGCGGAYSDGEAPGEYTDRLKKLGRFDANSGFVDKSSPVMAECDASQGVAIVGTYKPNAWGLYDMHGNVWEWCLDLFGLPAEMSSWRCVDPVGPTLELAEKDAGFRVMRGGAWNTNIYFCDSGFRNNSGVNYGGTETTVGSTSSYNRGARLAVWLY